MTRSTMLLAILGGVLVVVLWFLFLYKPATDELADVNAEIVSAQDQQRELEAQLEQLRSVRSEVTSIEAQLAAYHTVISPDPGLPALLRQLQTAANDSGLDLRSVSPGTPSPVEELPEIQSMSVAVELVGSYFQLVDFLRRVEDPVIVGRAMLIDGLDVSVDEYPTLTIGVTGRIFTTGEFGIVPQTPTEQETEPDAGEQPTDGASPTASPTEVAS